MLYGILTTERNNAKIGQQEATHKLCINFKICLLSFNWRRKKDPELSLGVAMIATYVKRTFIFGPQGTILLINKTVKAKLKEVAVEIILDNPKVLGISVYCWNVELVRRIVKCLRKLGYKGTIILGGPEITYREPEELGDFIGVNYFVRGDGEVAFARILESIINDTIPFGDGIYDSDGTLLGKNPIAHINEFFSPFSIYSDQLITTKFTRWQTQRGCPYECSYCAFPNKSRKVAYVSIDDVIKDILIFKRKRVREIAVIDPVFFLDKKRAMKILQVFHKELPDVRIEIQTRLEHLNDELLTQIAKMNIVLEAGIQTLDPNVQREINRFAKKDIVVSMLQKIKNYKIPLEAHLIYGLPKQTLESFIQDLILLLQLGVPVIRIFPLELLTGTKLHENKEFISTSQFSDSFPPEVVYTKYMSIKEIYFIDTKIQAMIKKYNYNEEWKNNTEYWIKKLISLLKEALQKRFIPNLEIRLENIDA